MSEPEDTNEAAGGRSDSTAVLGDLRAADKPPKIINIYGFTEPGHDSPAFVSLNMSDGKRTLTVRSRGTDTTASIELEADDLVDFASDILHHMHFYGEGAP
jgi:hypothetical protein